MRTFVGRGAGSRGGILALALALAACASPLPTGTEGPGTAARGPTRHLMAIGNLPIATITADSSASGLPPSRMLDADLATQWSNGGYRNATSWVQAGLAASTSLANVTIKTPPNAGTYDIQVSGTGTTWTTVRTGLFNTTWNAEVKALPAGTTGRFVRISWRNRATSPLPHFSVYHLRLAGETGSATPPPSATPTPTASRTPTPAPTPTPTGGLICPSATPAPGGGTTCYPAGTVFVTGNVRITVGKGGVFTPNHVYIRPGATTTIVNVDTMTHTFDGFNGATFKSGPIAPGASITKGWTHPGTWYFRSNTVPNPPTFALTDVPY